MLYSHEYILALNNTAIVHNALFFYPVWSPAICHPPYICITHLATKWGGIKGYHVTCEANQLDIFLIAVSKGSITHFDVMCEKRSDEKRSAV